MTVTNASALRWFAHWLGVSLILLAIAAVPSVAIVPSYAGGSALHGRIEDGRYFVDPHHGMPSVEVSESTWRTVYWVERFWPLTVLVPLFSGLFLVDHGKRRNALPPNDPPKDFPPGMLRACLVGAVAVVVATRLFWGVTGAPWATMLFGWIFCCAAVGTIVRLYGRSFRP